MKNLISALGAAILGLLPLNAQIINPYVFAGPTSCATTDTSLAYGHFLEGFQAATVGYNDGNAWTVDSVVGTGTVSAYYDTSALTTNKPAGACDRAWRVVLPTDGTETYQVWDRGSSYTMGAAVLRIIFHLYIEVAPDSGENYPVFRYGSTATGTGYFVSLDNVSGTLQLTAGGQTTSSAITVSSGEWIKVMLYLDTSSAGDTSYLQVNDGTPAYYRRNTQNPRYVSLGASAGLVNNESGTFLIDLICID